MARKAGSSTPTIETDSGPPPPAPEAPPPPEPDKPAEPAEKKADPTVLNVFTGEPNDPPGARRTPPADPPPGDGEKKQRKARKGKAAEPSPLTPEEEEAERAKLLMQARGVLTGLVNFQKTITAKQYAGFIPAHKLERIIAQLDLTPQELEAMAVPLAEGMAQEGIVLPWWAQLGFAFAGGPLLRQLAVKAELDAEVKSGSPDTVDALGWDAKTGNPT